MGSAPLVDAPVIDDRGQGIYYKLDAIADSRSMYRVPLHPTTQRLEARALLRLQRVVRPVPGQQVDELAALLRADLVRHGVGELDLAQVVAELRESKVRQAGELRKLDALLSRRVVEVERRVRVLLPAWNIDR